MRLAAVALLLLAGFPACTSVSAWNDVPTRPGVTQGFLYAAPEKPRAAAILFAGDGGVLSRLEGNFLVRSRDLFVERGVAVAVIAPPSDRQDLIGFRQTPEHVQDVRAVIAWLRKQAGVPVWLIGTSRGTQSAGFVATQLTRADGGPDGVVLTSSILRGAGPRDRPVPDMPLSRIAVPVLVVHHTQDSCPLTAFADVSMLTAGLTASPRKELIAVEGGRSEGDPCQAFSYHGYNGIEREVVRKIAEWMLRASET